MIFQCYPGNEWYLRAFNCWMGLLSRSSMDDCIILKLFIQSVGKNIMDSTAVESAPLSIGLWIKHIASCQAKHNNWVLLSLKDFIGSQFIHLDYTVLSCPWTMQMNSCRSGGDSIEPKPRCRNGRVWDPQESVLCLFEPGGLCDRRFGSAQT